MCAGDYWVGISISNLLPQYDGLDELTMPGYLLQSSSISTPGQLVHHPVAERKHSREDLSVFFGIGITINVILVVAFFIWAFKQWKKNDTSDK